MNEVRLETLEIIDLNKIRLAFDDINDFNDKFDLGRIIGENTGRSFNKEQPKTALDVESEAFSEYTTLKSYYEDDLKKYGLALELDNKKFSIFSGVEEFIGFRINMVISDIDRLITQLQTIDNPSLEDAAIVEKISGMIFNQIKDQYNSESKDDGSYDLIFKLKPYVDAAIRICAESSKEIQRLKNYLTAIKGKYLSEYLYAETSGVITLLDHIPELIRAELKFERKNVIEEQCNELIHILQNLYQNSNARDLYNKILFIAKTFIQIIKTEVNSWPQSPDGTTTTMTKDEVDKLNSDEFGWNKFMSKSMLLNTIERFEKQLVEYNVTS